MWLMAGIVMMLLEIAGLYVGAAYMFGDWIVAGAAVPATTLLWAPIVGMTLYPFLYMEFGPPVIRCPICGSATPEQKMERCHGACAPIKGN